MTDAAGALVVGGTPAGVQAALDLADSGLPVHLVAAGPFVGVATDSTGNLPQNARLLEVTSHPRITLWTDTRLAVVDEGSGCLHIQLRQQPRYVDLARCNACGDCVAACPVTVPGTARKAVSLPEGAQPGCAVIEKSGRAPCTAACPGGISVQGYVGLIAQGRFQEALDLVREAIPFPGICGRVCTHPCEINCRRNEMDEAVAIRRLKRFLSDWALAVAPPVSLPTDTSPGPNPVARQVAVVGSGPAGMTVAERLARSGCRVTVFEKLPVPGGMMAVGIPAYRLPPEVIAREYRRIEDLGVELRLNTAVGPEGDHSLEDLFRLGFQAVCLAIGAHRSLELPIAGADLPGVVRGLDLLKTIRLGQQLDDPTYRQTLDRLLPAGSRMRAVVLGGGNTAMDAARSLKRVGLPDVRVLYRRSRAEMPASPVELAEAEEEGVSIAFLTAPIRFVGDARTGVQALECIRMVLGEPGADGRRRPVPAAGSEFRVEADLVVLAIGQTPDLDVLGSDPAIAWTRDGHIRVTDKGFMTGRPGVFAVGDAVSGERRSVIEAIGMGKQAAAEIGGYLRGVSPREGPPATTEVPIAHRALTVGQTQPVARVAAPMLPLDLRRRTFDEVEGSYTATQAMAEAGRCLVCGPCSECLACVSACKAEAVAHRQAESQAELTVGALLLAEDPGELPGPLTAAHRSVYRALPESPLEGSAAAARVMQDLFRERLLPSEVNGLSKDGRPARIGVFLCRCGDQIARVIDTEALCRRAKTWPDVHHAAVVDFACLPEGVEAIGRAAESGKLNRVVLAACACCSLEQVCDSCTYQRVRCKRQLGLFGGRNETPLAPGGPMDLSRWVPTGVELVNVREHCAWIHADDPAAATAKATALVAGGVSKIRFSCTDLAQAEAVPPSVLILGTGAAAESCLGALRGQGFSVAHLRETPEHIRRTHGRYAAYRNGRTRQAGGVVLMPSDGEETRRLQAAFEGPLPLRDGDAASARLDTARPGVLFCDPRLQAQIAGEAAAARMAAWLGRFALRPALPSVRVDPARCRTCGTCAVVCEIGAAELSGVDPGRYAWIDPRVCTGCGACAAHCPSGAIRPGEATDAQLEAMLTALLA